MIKDHWSREGHKVIVFMNPKATIKDITDTGRVSDLEQTTVDSFLPITDLKLSTFVSLCVLPIYAYEAKVVRKKYDRKTVYLTLQGLVIVDETVHAYDVEFSKKRGAGPTHREWQTRRLHHAGSQRPRRVHVRMEIQQHHDSWR
jgi:hypothetical protein